VANRRDVVSADSAPLDMHTKKRPSLVLLHGFTGRAESWHRLLSLWPDPIPAYVPALPGHHRDAPLLGSWSKNVAGLADAIATHAQPPVTLVGYSLGARLALGLLAEHRALVARALLVGVNPGVRDAAARQARARDDARWAALLRARGLAAFVDRWQALPLFQSQQTLPAVVLEEQRSLRLAHDAEALAESLEQLGLAAMPDYWSMLCDSDREIALVVGGLDEKFLRIARELSRLASGGIVSGALFRVRPRLSLHVVEDCGHNVLLEAPEALANIIADFAARRSK
jgi:2-succinyl-6-hydroxy-2,4-cyclohexadiene-1-carboxylate synthase